MGRATSHHRGTDGESGGETCASNGNRAEGQVTALTAVLAFWSPYCRLGGTEFVAEVSCVSDLTPASGLSIVVFDPGESDLA